MARRPQLTDKQAYELYLYVWPGDAPWTTEVGSWLNKHQTRIAQEVRDLLYAQTLDDAFRICEEWVSTDAAKRRLRREIARLRRIAGRRLRSEKQGG